MPRGVYDRSKLKKNKATETAAPAQKTKGKPGRKPGSAKAVSVASPVKSSGNSIELLATVRANIETLTLVADKFGPSAVPGIAAEVAAHVNILSDLRKQVFGTGETQATEEKAETAQNGTSAIPGTPAVATVPMPPAPIPSLAATH